MPGIKARQPMQCDKMDEVVYNAARAFQAARLVAKAIQARLILLRPEYSMDKSDLAKKAIYEIGGKEYLVIMAGGHHSMLTPAGDALIAYALP